MRGQLRPEVTLGVGHGQRQNGRANVVIDLTTLALAPDGEGWSSQHLADPLRQFLTWHAKNLQLPIARAYLLLKRALRLIHQRRRLHTDPLGQQRAEDPGQLANLGLAPSRWSKAYVEILPTRLASRRERQSEAHQRMGHESLGVGDRKAAAAQGPLPHPGDVAVAGETDLPRLGEAQPEAALVLRKHG